MKKDVRKTLYIESILIRISVLVQQDEEQSAPIKFLNEISPQSRENTQFPTCSFMELICESPTCVSH